jgi:hypothetical protein
MEYNELYINLVNKLLLPMTPKQRESIIVKLYKMNKLLINNMVSPVTENNYSKKSNESNGPHGHSDENWIQFSLEGDNIFTAQNQLSSNSNLNDWTYQSNQSKVGECFTRKKSVVELEHPSAKMSLTNPIPINTLQTMRNTNEIVQDNTANSYSQHQSSNRIDTNIKNKNLESNVNSKQLVINAMARVNAINLKLKQSNA